MPDKDKKIKVVAEVDVTSGGTTETIRSFDASWHRAMELPTPVRVEFKRWARIDK